MVFDPSHLDSTVHGPIRLGALTLLQTGGALDFTALKKSLKVPDGSLAMHLGKLEECGYVSVSRKMIGKRQRSTFRITPDGKVALLDYLASMQSIIDRIRENGSSDTP